MPKASLVVLPAAGHSRRMRGTHKLLLRWNNHRVIDEVLHTWTTSPVTAVVVVVRRDDRPLQKAVRNWPSVDLLIPEEDPPEMKKSVRIGLHFLQSTRNPVAEDRWLIAPSDLPTLRSTVIEQVIEASESTDQIVCPRFGGRPGHPVSLPWSTVPQIDMLPPDQGINSLLESQPTHWVDLPPDQYPQDIDTPEQYGNYQ